MPWEFRENSGPYVAPWDGKDVTGWIWEIYDGDKSHRVLVEVSGTAMAVAEEYLPAETAAARATLGRSEVEKILAVDDPPRRITLGTAGYVGAPPKTSNRPDFLMINEQGMPVAAVEVKRAETLTRDAAFSFWRRLANLSETRGRVRFFLAVSQERGFLFDTELGPDEQGREFPMLDVVRAYYPEVGYDERFRSAELALVVGAWLNDVARGGPPGEGRAEQTLAQAGFLEAVRGSLVQPA